MKNYFLILFTVLNFSALGDYCWVQKANVGSFNRYAAMGFEINGKGYLGCGYANGAGNNDFWEYDPTSNSWTQKANYPGGNIWAGSGFSIGNKGYFALGTDGVVFIGTIYEYNPVLNAWTSKAPFPALARQDCFGFSANNFGYIVGGWRSGNYFNDLHKYDPVSNTWTSQANFIGVPRSGLRGFVIGTTAYCGTGWIGGSALSDMAAYNTLTNTWTGIAPLPGPVRNSGSSFTMNGKGFMGNGYNSLFYNDFYEYDPTLNNWTQIPSFPGQTKTYTVSFTLGGNGYISTGRYGSISSLSNQTWMLTEGPEALFSTNTSGCNSVNFTNSSTNSTSYLWTFGDGTNSTLANPLHSYSTSGNYTVTLVANNGSCYDTLTQVVTVTANVTANFIATVSNCSSTILLQNNSTNATSYVWQWGNGQQSIGNQTSYTYSSPGSYTITLISSDGNCADTVTQNINVPQSLNATLNLSTDCNNNVFISNFISNGNSFLWLWGDGQQTTGNAVSHSYINSGSYTISLILSNGTCTDTLTYPITINSSPIANFTVNPNCDLSVSISNTSSNSTQYLWNWGNGQNTVGNVNSHLYPVSGSYTITLIAQNGTCTDTMDQSITINPIVNSQFSATPNCNLGISLQNTSNNALSYQWIWGDGNNNTSNTSYYQYGTSGNYLVSLIAYNGICSDTTNLSVSVDTFPISSIISSFNVCHDTLYLSSQYNSSSYFWDLGDGSSSNLNSIANNYAQQGTYTITLINTNTYCTDTTNVTIDMAGTITTNIISNISCDGILSAQALGSTNWTYNWDLGDGTISNLQIVNHQYQNPSNYLIQLTVNNGYCIDSTSTILVYEAGITHDVTTNIDSCSRNIKFTILPTPNTSVNWSFGDGTFATINNPTHHYELPIVYSCQVIIDPFSNCADTVNLQVDLSNLTLGSDLFIPNSFTPNNDLINDKLHFNNELCDFEEINIFNRWGYKVFHSKNQKFEWDGTYNGTPLPEGVYILLVKFKNDTFQTPLTILR